MKQYNRSAFVPLALVLILLLVPGLAGADTTASIMNGPATIYATAQAGSLVIGELQTGTRVQVISFDDNWAELNLGSGQKGYVAMGFINFGAPGPAPTQRPMPNPVATAYVRSGPLNVHSSASLGAPVITQLPTGTRVQLAGYNGNWAEVILVGETGFVVTSYLTIGGTHPQPTATPAEHERVETAGANATIATGNGGPLHLRSHPSPDADILDTYANGSRIEVLSQSAGWYHVRAGSDTGYMDIDFVRLDSGVQVAGNNGYDATVNNPTDGEVLHLRRHPSTTSDSLGSYHNGTYVEVLDVGVLWHHVIVEGMEGYMVSDYVRFTSPNVTAERTVDGGAEGTVIVRSTASATSSEIAQLSTGDTLMVMIPDAEWAQVQVTVDGEARTGYVPMTSLMPLPILTQING